MRRVLPTHTPKPVQVESRRAISTILTPRLAGVAEPLNGNTCRGRQTSGTRPAIMPAPRPELEKQYMSTKPAKKVAEPRPSARYASFPPLLIQTPPTNNPPVSSSSPPQTKSSYSTACGLPPLSQAHTSFPAVICQRHKMEPSLPRRIRIDM